MKTNDLDHADLHIARASRYDDYGFQPIVVFDADGRFVIVTNLGHGSGRSLYQDLCSRCGRAENYRGP